MGDGLMEGVLLTEERRIEVSGGDVLHAMKKSSPGFCGFGEAYFSVVEKNILKGWKKHKEVTLNLVVPVGEIEFLLVDDRQNSKTQGDRLQVILSPERYQRLTVPPGLWMAFKGKGEFNVLLNMIDQEHRPEEAEVLPPDAFPV